jgi:hypothetical protein
MNVGFTLKKSCYFVWECHSATPGIAHLWIFQYVFSLYHTPNSSSVLVAHDVIATGVGFNSTHMQSRWAFQKLSDGWRHYSSRATNRALHVGNLYDMAITVRPIKVKTTFPLTISANFKRALRITAPYNRPITPSVWHGLHTRAYYALEELWFWL